jgi:ribose-phosphate pyrophosphokinase
VVAVPSIDTGGTIAKAAAALKDAGARGVTIACTHAIFSGKAVEYLSQDIIDQVVVTDTLPVGPEKRFDKLTVLPIAPLLAKAIHEVFEDGSVTSMFEGAA